MTHWGALPAHARRAMVVTADAHATGAGVEALRDGGNAVDAAIAAAFALCVTQPGMCGLGGGGQWVSRHADGGTLCLDFRETAPAAADADMFTRLGEGASTMGWKAAATPGTVRGLEEAHRLRGKLSWPRLLEPAIRLAAEGHEVSWLRAQMLRSAAALREDPESWRILLREGRPFEPGERLIQPELARTLERIAREGSQDFYEGRTAALLVRAMERNGGLIAPRDLREYTVARRKPLAGRYRDYDVLTMPPSSAGGIGLLQMLGILEAWPPATELSAAVLHRWAEAMRRCFAERARAIGDPDHVRVPVDELLSREHIAQIRASIGESACTTHLSVLDAEGSAVAFTFTLNGIYGSGVTVPGLGFLLNNNMDNFATRPGRPNQYGVMQGEAAAVGPGRRPVSSMTPTIVLQNGSSVVVAGTPGGPTIVTAMLQVLLYLLDFGYNAQEALNQPRIHHQWTPDVLYVERGFAAETLEGLRQRGHTLELRASNNDCNAILVRDGWIEGAADPRREGKAAGL